MQTNLRQSLLFVLRSMEPGILVAVLLGATLRFTRLGEYDNSYYTATVSSMLQSTHNFFFASFDTAGVVMVDKPPVSFWVQGVSAAIFGVSSWSVVLPQVIAGILAIAILYWIIRRVFGPIAAIVSSMVMAVVPASVIIDSRNEPDSLLAFTLLLAAVSIILAVQTGKWRWLIAFGVLMGISFNTKMLIAFIPLPAFLMYYTFASNYPIRQIIVRVATAMAVLILVSMSWVTIVALTPAENRPFVGSTPDNAIQTLVVKYNGINRFTSFIGPRPRQPLRQQLNRPVNQFGRLQSGNTPSIQTDGNVPTQIPPINREVTDRGLLGLFSNPLANQLGWLLPLSLLSVILLLVPTLSKEVYRKPITFFTILRQSHVSGQAIMWAAWLGTALVTFGLANSTTTHAYYLVGIVTPLSATIGIGAYYMFNTFKNRSTFSWLLLLVLIISAFYQMYGAYSLIADWVMVIVISGISVAVLIMAIGLYKNLQTEHLTISALAFGTSALLIIPLVISVTAGDRIGNLPHAPAMQPNFPPESTESPNVQLSQFLLDNGVDSPGTIILGTVRAREAAPFIIQGISSIAIGGFSGTDPIFTIDSFRNMASEEGPQYFFMPSQGRATNVRRKAPQEPILGYIRKHWEDGSHFVELPLGTLYVNPN